MRIVVLVVSLFLFLEGLLLLAYPDKFKEIINGLPLRGLQSAGLVEAMLAIFPFVFTARKSGRHEGDQTRPVTRKASELVAVATAIRA